LAGLLGRREHRGNLDPRVENMGESQIPTAPALRALAY
jgi:hypothetical protein